MQVRKFAFLSILLAGGMLLALYIPSPAPAVAQQATGSIPTVTGTPSGPTVSVDPSLEQIDVYAGPSSFNYPAIGVLLTGVKAPALGRARDDTNWIMIRYYGVPGSIGWVYALYVSLNRGAEDSSILPLVDSPFTPTPASTPTINPTLAAAFIGTQVATRLPTYTPPASFAIPTFADQTQPPSRIPIGLLIFGFLFIGALGIVVSFLRGR
ncbi:MAG: SH3 domain-containing protein [Chloroflexi bacterium]|nr:SH3 domain-containing protein [Chloroflexota bacterium]MBI3339592.1 SH3 domain-containing protein [Chloroflexota bacterium]